MQISSLPLFTGWLRWTSSSHERNQTRCHWCCLFRILLGLCCQQSTRRLHSNLHVHRLDPRKDGRGWKRPLLRQQDIYTHKKVVGLIEASYHYIRYILFVLGFAILCAYLLNGFNAALFCAFVALTVSCVFVLFIWIFFGYWKIIRFNKSISIWNLNLCEFFYNDTL